MGVLLAAGEGIVILFVFLDYPPTAIVKANSFLNDRLVRTCRAVCGIVSLLGCFNLGVLLIGDLELHFLWTCIAGINSLIVNCPALFACIVKATWLSLCAYADSVIVSFGLKLARVGNSPLIAFSSWVEFAKSG